MIELIPAIDIIDGKCVRLSQGDYDSKKVYNENPVEVALELEAHGIRRLHVVDLDGAASHHVVNYRTLEQIAVRTSLIIDFGGGVKSDEDLVIAFENGAQMVTGGSIAVKNPESVSYTHLVPPLRHFATAVPYRGPREHLRQSYAYGRQSCHPSLPSSRRQGR